MPESLRLSRIQRYHPGDAVTSPHIQHPQVGVHEYDDMYKEPSNMEAGEVRTSLVKAPPIAVWKTILRPQRVLRLEARSLRLLCVKPLITATTLRSITPLGLPRV